jgi:hypothetical protein
MSFELEDAVRTTIKPLIVFFAESGCGKTMSALLLARGFVGPKGLVAMADSESGRGSLYADVIPGGYKVLTLEPPFTPARYLMAMDAIEKSASIGILDSGSHEWDAVLDMAGENEHRSGKAGLHNWREPKIEHAKFVQRLLRARIPWIVCLRAKFKTRQGKENGKTVIIKDDFPSAIQADDFLFEATFSAEVLPDHSLRVTKTGHPELVKAFPGKGEMITEEHGRRLAAWCSTPQGPGTAGKPTNERDELAKRLWSTCQSIHRCPEGADKATKKAAAQALSQWLWDQAIMSDTEALSEVPASRLTEMISKAEFTINNPPVP